MSDQCYVFRFDDRAELSRRIIETAELDGIAFLIPDEEQETKRLSSETIKCLNFVWSGFPKKNFELPTITVERRMY